jgi:hypothetical protein
LCNLPDRTRAGVKAAQRRAKGTGSLDAEHDRYGRWNKEPHHVTPLTRLRNSLYYHMGPGTRDQGPGTRDQGPGTRDQGPGARGQGPGARGQGPGTRDQGPGTRDQGPALEAPKLRSSEAPKLRSSEAPKLRSSEAPKLRSSEAPKLRSSEAPKLRSSKLEARASVYGVAVTQPVSFSSPAS